MRKQKLTPRFSVGSEFEFKFRSFPERRPLWSRQSDPTTDLELRSPVLEFTTSTNLQERFNVLKELELIISSGGRPRYNSSTGNHVHVAFGENIRLQYVENYNLLGMTIIQFAPLIYSMSSAIFRDANSYLSSRQFTGRYCYFPTRSFTESHHYCGLSRSGHATLEIRFPDALPPTLIYPNMLLYGTIAMSTMFYGYALERFERRDLSIVRGIVIDERNRKVGREEYREQILSKLLTQLYYIPIPKDAIALLALFRMGIFTPHLIPENHTWNMEWLRDMFTKRIFVAKKYIDNKHVKQVLKTISQHGASWICGKTVAKMLNVEVEEPKHIIVARRIIWRNPEERRIIEALTGRDVREVRQAHERYYLIVKNTVVLGYLCVDNRDGTFVPVAIKLLRKLNDEEINQILMLAEVITGESLRNAFASLLEVGETYDIRRNIAERILEVLRNMDMPEELVERVSTAIRNYLNENGGES